MVNIDNESASSWDEKSDRDSAPTECKSWLRRWWIIISVAVMLSILALALGLGLGLGLRHDGAGSDVIVDLGYTKYRGQAFNDGTSQWLGMRYAAAPVGQLRFASPRPAPSTNKVQPALAVSR